MADPRNAARSDLRCPFGCRETQRRRRAAERGKAYYRTEWGWKKKKALNGRRSSPRPAAQASTVAASTVQAHSDLRASLRLLLSYLCRALTLIERRPVGTGELLPILQTLRQRRMVCVSRPQYLSSTRPDRPP